MTIQKINSKNIKQNADGKSKAEAKKTNNKKVNVGVASPDTTNHTRKVTQSKLSRGPKNAAHKTFVRNERSINAALCRKLSCRRVDVKAREIYNDAGVTRPTFYLHYRNTGDALAHYEASLENGLREIMPDDAKRDIFYVNLTSHVARNRKYFQATAKCGSHYWLQKMITEYRVNLVGDKINDRAFNQYIGSVVVVINCWLELDGITPETTAACIKELVRIRPIQW